MTFNTTNSTNINGTITTNIYIGMYSYSPTPSPTLPPLTLPTVPKTTLSVDIVGLIISIISITTLIIIIKLCSQYLLTKRFFPKKFYIKYALNPPTLKLILYLQWMDLFILFSQCYILARNLQSFQIWRKHCNSYNYFEDPNANPAGQTDDVFPECDADKYCYIWYDNISADCDPTSTGIGAVAILMIIMAVINAILALARYCLTAPCTNKRNKFEYGGCGDSCCMLYGNKQIWVGQYLDREFFRDCWITLTVNGIRYVLFFILVIPYYFLYDGPVRNYIEWYTLFPILILWILNEFIIKCIIYPSYPKYDYNNHVLYLLEQVFDTNIAKMIWVDYANQNMRIKDFKSDEVQLVVR
eukprot:280505_1